MMKEEEEEGLEVMGSIYSHRLNTAVKRVRPSVRGVRRCVRRVRTV